MTMKPIKTATTTTVLGAPRDWDEERLGECVGLPVAYGDGCISSYWSPTWRERLAILMGRPVRLTVAGLGHPPVMLDVEPDH